MVRTEQLKKDLLVIAKIVNLVDNALEDGKVNVAEGVGLAFKAIDLIGVIKNFKQAQEELMDLTSDEVPEIVEAFKQEFDIDNDKAEEVVETVIELALNLVLSLDMFK